MRERPTKVDTAGKLGKPSSLVKGKFDATRETVDVPVDRRDEPSEARKLLVMSKGPRGERRPADLIGNAVHVAKIATGEIEDTKYEQPNKVRAGRAGGRARSESLSSDERGAIARKAGTARWDRG